MKHIASILIVFALSAAAVFADIPPGWPTNFAAIVGKGGERPVLCFFTASWCGPCKLMTHITLTDPTVTDMLGDWDRVAVDIDQQPAIAAQHGIEAVPTFVLFTAGGREVKRTTGYHDADEFIAWLTNGMATVAVAQAQQKWAQERLARAISMALSTNSLPDAARQLLDLLPDADPAEQKAVLDQLAVLAAKDPALLLPGLEHPRLIVRIRTANLLHDKLGDDFAVDPWADADVRHQAVVRWQEKLAGPR